MQAMIEEAIDNKEQKAKQRAKEYERKREAKWRNRQMYHMRHTRDYDALGLPIGASKVDVKAAYKKLAGAPCKEQLCWDTALEHRRSQCCIDSAEEPLRGCRW